MKLGEKRSISPHNKGWQGYKDMAHEMVDRFHSHVGKMASELKL